MGQRTDKKIHPIFGIRRKMGLAVGIVVILISAVSFSLAVYLHMVLAFFNAISEDVYSDQMIAAELDPEALTRIFDQGMEIYNSIPEEIRRDRMSAEYISHFEALKTDEYEEIRQELSHLGKFEDLKWMDLRIYDEENDRWIFLMDTEENENDRYPAGYWEYIEETPIYSDAGEEIEEDSSFMMLLESLTYIDLREMERFDTIAYFNRPGTDDAIGFVATRETYSEFRRELSMFWILHLAAIVILLIVVFLLSDFIINRWLVKPMLELSTAAADYVADRDKTRDTRHFDRVRISSNDELLLLKESMVDMESELAKYVLDIARMTAEKEREEAEMNLSARIQASFLPHSLGDFGGERSFEVSALIHPAREVGGDFYDYYVIDDDHIGITIADVSDKGVPAALFMIVTSTLLEMAGRKYTSPAEAIERVNKDLYDQNAELMFVTIFFGIYTVSEKKLVYVNAGHEDMALYRKEKGAYALERERHDTVVAVDPDAKYTDHILRFSPGDRLFLYTDGVTEARNPRDEILGEDRMTEELNALKDERGEAFLAKMRERILAFASGEPQSDDITMMLLEIT